MTDYNTYPLTGTYFGDCYIRSGEMNKNYNDNENYNNNYSQNYHVIPENPERDYRRKLWHQMNARILGAFVCRLIPFHSAIGFFEESLGITMWVPLPGWETFKQARDRIIWEYSLKYAKYLDPTIERGNDVYFDDIYLGTYEEYVKRCKPYF